MERKTISKKKRFEIFKRDSFKCQYCGSSSPDVVLEVDHIKPVSEGGSNDITNLITSCFDCNRGKGAKMLDDNSVLEKQRLQLEELNEKRNQLEMMMEWREGLKSIEEDKVDIISEKWKELTIDFTLNETGVKSARKLLKKIDLSMILDCMEISAEQYLVWDEKEDTFSKGSVEKAWDYIGRIATNKKRGEEEPYMKDLYYIRGIMRNRYISYHKPQMMIDYLKKAHVECDVSIESLKEFAKNVKHWTEFRTEMEKLFEGEDIEY